jgi:hypothetical protein
VWTASIIRIVESFDKAAVVVEYTDGVAAFQSRITDSAPGPEWPASAIAAQLAALELVAAARSRIELGPVTPPAAPTAADLAQRALVEAQRAHASQELLVAAGAATAETLTPLVAALRMAAIAAGKPIA